MTTASYIAMGICLSIVAALASMLGIGGGSLNTPIQVFFGYPIHGSAANSLLFIAVLSIGATLIYGRSGKVDWKLAMVLVIFNFAGGFLGGYFAGDISERGLTAVLAVVVFLSGLSMIASSFLKPRSRPVKSGVSVWRRRLGSEEYSINLLAAFPLSFAAGAASGLVGIGGGMVTVPMLVILFAVPVDIAIGTSALMVGITAFGGLLGHIVAGGWVVLPAIGLLPGIIIGSIAGAKLMLHISKNMLKRIFGISLIFISIILVKEIFQQV